MDLGIEGRVAVVAASSRGIGLACAKALASEGTNVVLCARDSRSLEEAKSQIEQLQRGRVEAVVADIHERAARDLIFDTAHSAFGTIDILIVNTPGGVAGFKPIVELTHEEWNKAINCKFHTAVELCNAVMPEMIKQRWGRIVNLNTYTSLEPLPDYSLSNSMRLATIGFFRTLALEVGAKGIIANSVAIGHTKTATLDNYFEQIAERRGVPVTQVEQDIISATPIRRLLKTQDVAALVTFLCSESTGGITGQTFRVDGGFSKAL